MGYGHLRAARAIAERLGTRVRRADALELAGSDEVSEWRRLKSGYETLSRATDWPVVGAVASSALDRMTRMGGVRRDPSLPDLTSRRLQSRIRAGLGAELVRRLRSSGERLISTFYAPAIAAAEAGLDATVCVVTDVDVHRIWAPVDASRTPLWYCVPAERTRSRLISYGVSPGRVVVTGFPLPPRLAGSLDPERLRRHLRRRQARLDPCGRSLPSSPGEVEPEPREGPLEPPRITFTVGGAGAQRRQLGRFLRALLPEVACRRLRLSVSVGTHEELLPWLRRLADEARVAVHGDRFQIVHRKSVDDYLVAFEELLAHSDALVTKPSEMSFYAALGLPLILTTPLGDHERANREWLLENGAAVTLGDDEDVLRRMQHWLESGTLAHVAWNAYQRLPRHGARRIAEFVGD